jgi:hypothetical protein
VLLAPVFHQSGAAVYYRADRDLSLDVPSPAESATFTEQHSRFSCVPRSTAEGLIRKGEICLDGARASDRRPRQSKIDAAVGSGLELLG